MPSLCKHHLDTADAKGPKHHLDTSRKPPKPQAKKTLSRHFWNPYKTKTIFGATEHMPSLCKHHLDAADAKRPKHHLDTSRKPPKPQAKKLFHVTFEIHIKQKQSLEPQSTCPAYANTIWTLQMPSLCKHHLDTADAKRPKHHLDTSRKPPKPQAKISFTLPCPAYANTIWTLQMQKDPNTIWTRAENRPNRKPKNSFTVPLESTLKTKTIFGATEHMPSLCKHHLEPHKTTLEPQSTCPAYANTI